MPIFRLLLLSAAIALTYYSPTLQAAAPARVVSINLCTDELLFSLAERNRIVSVSFLAADPEYSYYWDQIGDIPINNALVEEILPLRPDLVLAGKYTDKATVNFLKSFGLNVKQIDIPENFDGIIEAIREVAQLLGSESRGEFHINRIKQKISATKAQLALANKITAAIIAPNNFTSGTRTFKSELIEIAGFKNIAGDYGIEWYGTLQLEQIISSQPQVLFIDGGSTQENSLAQRLLKHPALHKGLPNTQVLNIPGALWNCGGPIIVEALDRLVEFHAQQTY